MNRLILIVLLCFGISITHGQVVSALDFDPLANYKTDPKWPECDSPDVIIEVGADEESSHIHIDGYDQGLEYQFLLVNRYTNDSIFYTYHLDPLLLNSDLFSFNIFSKVHCTNSLSSDWKQVKVSNLESDERSSNCFGSKLHSYHSIEDNKLLLSFASNSGDNNQVYDDVLEDHIKFDVDWEDSNGNILFTQVFFSNVTLGEIGVDPDGDNPYIYVFEAPEDVFLGSVAVTTGATDDCINFVESTDCDKVGTTCSIGSQIYDLSQDPNTNQIDLSDYFCGQDEIDYSTLCSFTSNMEGEIQGDDLYLSFSSINQQEFQDQLDETGVSLIQIIVTGYSSTGSQSFQLPFWDKTMQNFNIATWSDYVPNFGSYTSFIVQFDVYDSNDKSISCNTYSELPISVDSEICEIFSFLKAKEIDETTIAFSFTDEDNPDYLSESLVSLGLSISQAKGIIDGELSSLDLTLSYATDGPYSQVEQTVDLSSGIDLLSFEVLFDVSSVNGFKASLTIEYFDSKDDKQTCLISPIQLEYLEDDEGIDELPVIDCNSIPLDLGNMSTELKADEDVIAGMVITINSFPLLILNITSGVNSSGISGEGMIPLPFKDKQLFVDFNDIQVNIDGQAIDGAAMGKNGPGIGAFPNFNLPPLYLGGDICIPPPTNTGLNGDGINPATGLTGYGFDPETGLHFLTGTEYDPNGYDADGNHKDTGELWNEDGCSRDGMLYVQNDETDVWEESNTPCDHTGGAADPQQLNAFKDSLNLVLLDSLDAVYNKYKFELLDERTGLKTTCDSLRTVLKDGSISINSPMAYGMNDILIEEGMHEHFSNPPELFSINGERDEIQLSTEVNHIALYTCDVDYKVVNDRYTEYLKYKNKLDGEIKDEILSRVDELTQNELEQLQDPVKLGNWLLTIIKEYITEDSGQTFAVEENTSNYNDNPYLKESQYYNAVVSNDNSIFEKGSKLDALAFEYEQGFNDIMGYPRPIITETLRKYQMAIGAENIGSLLPINIDKSTSRFDISILISNVTFYPTSASMDVACVITDKNNNDQKLAFGGEGLPLSVGALNEESAKLFLLNDVGIRLNNASRLQLKSGPNATFVQWGCDGFEGMFVKGGIQFCREYVLPLNDSNEVITDPNVLYELEIDAFYPGMLEFAFEVSAPPFELTTMRGYKWEIGKMGVDFTTMPIDGLELEIPKDYNSTFFDKETLKLDDLWKGFYAQDINLVLPKDLFGNGTNTYYAAVKSMIIDDTGLTTLVKVGNDPGIIKWEEGNANGWQLSVEEMNLLVLQNSIAGGGFGGRIGLAVLKDPLEYSATIYNGGVLFSVSPDTTATFSPFGTEIKLFKNSFIQGEFNDQGFFAKAHLNGEIKFGGDEQDEELSILTLPELTFQGLEFQNVKEDGENKLIFSAGVWGIKTPLENQNNNPDDDKPIMSGFGISITELSVHSNETKDGLFLRVGVDVDLIKETLKAGGSFEIHGKLKEGESIFKMEYDKFRVNELSVNGSIKGILKVDGFVQWYDDTNASTNQNKYGKGFRGGLSAELEKLFPGLGVTAAAQFGKKGDLDYFFVDMVADIGDALKIGPVTFNKLGGGMAYGMYPDYTNIIPSPAFLTPSELKAKPLGTTLTGIQYVPTEDAGYEFKFMTGFYCPTEDIFNGTGELIVRLTPENSLDEIEIRAQGQFLSVPDALSYDAIADLAGSIPDAISSIDTSLIKVEDIPKPTTDATLSGFASFRYNFTRNEFAGKVAAYLNMPGGIVKGAGPNGALCIVDIYFGRKDWWIWVGEPTVGRRAGVLVDLAIIEAGIQAYFDIGTKVPPFPGLPIRVRHLGRDLSLNESNRASSFAFAFGASFNIDIDASVAGTGVELGIGAGFDIMLRKYEDVLCLTQDGPEEIGMDGWYAMGQAWAYIDGSIKIFGFNIASAGIATVLQLQTPNPTWGLAALEVYYKVLWHEGTWEGDVEFGDRCKFISDDPDNEFGMNLIVNMTPENGLRDFGVDGNVSANFILPLGDTIPEYNFFTGDPRPLSFQFDEDNFGLYNEDGKVECEVLMNKHINSVTFKPTNFLNRNDSMWFVVKIDIYDNFNYHSSQEKIVGFKTASGLEIIPNSNVEYTYPTDGMTNFFTEQHASQIGYIQLIKGQSNLFYADETDAEGNIIDYSIQAKFTSGTGYKVYSDLTYNPLSYRLEYEMPSEEFLQETMYKLEILKVLKEEAPQINSPGVGNKVTGGTNDLNDNRVLYTLYFRTSVYKKLEDKILAIVENGIKDNDEPESTVREASDDIDVYVKTKVAGTGEVFDVFDLSSNGNGRPYVRLMASNDIYNFDFQSSDRHVFVSYDDEFWPLDLRFMQITGYGYGGIAAQTATSDLEYSITEFTFLDKVFDAKSSMLKLGCFFHTAGDVGLKVYYNYPDGKSDTVLDAFIPAFIDNVKHVKTLYGIQVDAESFMKWDVTDEMAEAFHTLGN